MKIIATGYETIEKGQEYTLWDAEGSFYYDDYVCLIKKAS